MNEFDATGKNVASVSPDPENTDNSQETTVNGNPPQQQGYPQQPYTPQPQGYPQQPYIPRPHLQRSGKLNVGALILAICFLCAYWIMIYIDFTVYGGMASYAELLYKALEIMAGILLIFAVCIRGKAGNVLFAVGLFVSASGLAVILLSFFAGLIILDIAVFSVMVMMLCITGIMYLAANKAFNTVKLVLMIVMMLAGVVQFIYARYAFFSFELSSVLLCLPFPLANISLGICAILFKPFKQV